MISGRWLSRIFTWNDVHHIVKMSQKQFLPDAAGRGVYYSEFIRSMGIQEDETQVSPKLVFVLTPFNKNFLLGYEAIQAVCSKVGYVCIRGDEELIRGEIFPHILKQIIKASIIIANIEGRNPNVMYELGVAHAINKQVILVSRTDSKLPIDLKSKRIILYNSYRDLQLQLKDELLKVQTEQLANYSMDSNNIKFQ